MNRDKFYEKLTDFIINLNPNSQIPTIGENVNIFELGYVDSLNMVKIIAFLEETLGEEIALEKYELRSFYTMENMYNTFFALKSS